MSETHVADTKPLSRMQSLPERRGGSKVTNLFLVTLQSAGISLAGNLHNISLNEELNDCFPNLQNEKDLN